MHPIKASLASFRFSNSPGVKPAVNGLPRACFSALVLSVVLSSCGSDSGESQRPATLGAEVDSMVDGQADNGANNLVNNQDASSNTTPDNAEGTEDTEDNQQDNPQIEAPLFDFYGKALEIDTEMATAGGPPTTPKNLHINLLGNDWVEMDWAPSNDDVQVVAYRIYRDDGVMHTVESPAINPAVNDERTLHNYWNTTTFIDCNFTHLRICDQDGYVPDVGSTHRYQVTAVDNEGNESARSNMLQVKFHEEQGAVVEHFTDPYLDGDDDFLFETNLSNTRNFMNQFQLIWSDEFDGSEIDASKWSTSLTWDQADENIINGEMQYFVDTQSQPDFGYNPFILNGETLTISAIRTPPELIDKALGQEFLSGALATHEIKSGQLDNNGVLIQDKFATTYGYVEGRIRVGTESGMLTSFYLFRRWAAEHSPEIDIIEYLGENPYGDEKAFQTYHYRDTVHDRFVSTPTMQHPRAPGGYQAIKDVNDFHTYGVLWEPNLVIWYIDGEEIQRLTGPQIARQSMNIILYLVTGSGWAPRPADDAVFPFEIEIDYVRAYKRLPWTG